MGIRDGVKRLLSYTLFGAMVLSVMQTGCQSRKLEAAEPRSVTVSVDQAAKEMKALLSKPLEESKKEKVWPDQPLRGLQTYSYTPSGDPVFLNEATFKKFKAWNINVLRLWIEVDPGSPSAVKPGETPPPAPADDRSPHTDLRLNAKVKSYLPNNQQSGIVCGGST